jgi:hypothetical protein
MVGVQRFMRVLAISVLVISVIMLAVIVPSIRRMHMRARRVRVVFVTRGIAMSRRRDLTRMREAFFRVCAKSRRRDARAKHALGGNAAVLDVEASERGAERLEREAEIEQSAEDHVAGRARETIEIGGLRHPQSNPFSRMLQ